MLKHVKVWLKDGRIRMLILITVLLAIMLFLTECFWWWLALGPPTEEPNGVMPPDSSAVSNSEILRNVGFLIAGVLALFFAAWRAWVAQSQADAAQGQTNAAMEQVNASQKLVKAAQNQTATAQQTLLNERYQRGAEMLGSNMLSVRLGGIYALQRLAEEHPDQYHMHVMRLFCAFVRDPVLMEQNPALSGELRADVQAVITAIGKRSSAGQRLEENRLDLRNARLRYADMKELNFTGANLQGAALDQSNLIGADLTGTDLAEAWLTQANLSDSVLIGADLSDARLHSANLAGADLSEAHLERAVMTRAILGTEPASSGSSETISGLNFRMTQQQLDQTYGDKSDPPKLNDAIDWKTCKKLTLDNWPSGS